MMIAEINNERSGIRISEPRRLFPVSFTVYDYAVAPDGRFLFIAPAQRSEPPTAVVVNWQQALRDRQ